MTLLPHPSLPRPRQGKKKGRQLTVPAPHKRKVTDMTIAPDQATGPISVHRSKGPAIPPRMRRRPLTFAALTRRATRRATWLRIERQGELPPIAMVTTIVGALSLALALTGWVVVW